MISRQAIPALLNRVTHSLPSTLPTPTPYLLPLLTATTLGHGSLFLPACLAHAYDNLPPRPHKVEPEPRDPRLDEAAHPRRFVSRLVKESLVKSSILIGVPKAIETLLDLSENVDPQDQSHSFVRERLDRSDSSTFHHRSEAGRAGLGTVYKGNIDDIFDTFSRGGLDDVRFFSEHITYGTFLTPFSDSTSSTLPPSPDPFSYDRRLLSLVTLSCLIPQSTPREILWHLRGALRRGWTRDQVEAVHRAIETVCESLGTNLSRDLPRVRDVDLQPEEQQ